MRLNFARFRDVNELEIIVNPLSVRYLMPGAPGTTRICFDNIHTIQVRGSPREVQRKLSADMEVWPAPYATVEPGL